MLHAKAFLIDEDVSTVGSANVDTRSFRLNFEIGCFLSDLNAGTKIARWYEELLGGSHRSTSGGLRARSTARRAPEYSGASFSPLLLMPSVNATSAVVAA